MGEVGPQDGLIVDIFIPYWGDPELAKQTINSVVEQNNSAWALTVVDDAYPGNELSTYVSSLRHPRINYLKKLKNAGITENFRTCVGLATLPLTVVIGCDDRLKPNYVDEIVLAHESFPNAAIIQPGVAVIDENGNAVRPLVDVVKTRLMRPRISGYRLLSGEFVAANLLTGNWLYWPSIAFRTDRIQHTPFRDGFPVTQDLALIMDMIFAGDQLLAFDTVCFEYRRHVNSASSVELFTAARFVAERNYFELASEIAASRGWRRAVYAARARLTSRAHALVVLPKVLLRGDLPTARALVIHGFGR